MNKLHLIALFLFISITNIYSQKIYVWCPDNQDNKKQRIGFLENDTIDVILYDNRSLPKKSMIKCDADNILNYTYDIIKNAYPSAILNLLDSEYYYKKPIEGRITIKIAITAYHAGFGRDITVAIGNVGGEFSYAVIPKGQWNGLTGFIVTVYNGDDVIKEEVSKLVSKPNLGGYRTAKSCLEMSYSQSIQSLLLFIDSSLM